MVEWVATDDGVTLAADGQWLLSATGPDGPAAVATGQRTGDRRAERPAADGVPIWEAGADDPARLTASALAMPCLPAALRRPDGAARDLPPGDSVDLGGVADVEPADVGPGDVESADGEPADGDTAPEDGSTGRSAVATTHPAGYTVVARFDAPSTVDRDAAGRVTVRFERAVTVRIGVADHGPDRVRVPPTPSGVARAITLAGRHHPAASAARSLPALRAVPPQFELAEGAALPAAPDGQHPARITVRPELASVFAAAPLAYYLGARIGIEADAEPTLETPERTVSLGADAAAATETLERCLWLDSLVRSVGLPDPPVELGLLEELDLSVDDPPAGGPQNGQPPSAESPALRSSNDGRLLAGLRDRGPGARLSCYETVSYAAIADRLPDWHVVTYAEPTASRARALPGVLSRLSHVVPPAARELGGRELMERTLDDFFRGPDEHDHQGGGVPPGGAPPSHGGGARTPVDVVDPELRPGHLHGWLADGTPLDVYKLLEAGYGDVRTGATAEAALEVTIVRNEASMAGEGTAVAAAYRAAPGASVSVVHDLDRAALREAFAAAPDLLHFVGHCDDAGLRCPDGNLSTAALEGPVPDAVVLNACGSYHEGVALVDGGVRAAAVTFRKVLDEQARTVGTTFAELFVEGFPMERALGIARRQIVMGKDYAVVGDGTHTLRPPDRFEPFLVDVSRRGAAASGDAAADGGESDPTRAGATGRDGERAPDWLATDRRFDVSCPAPGVPRPGGTVRPPLPGAERRLAGAAVETTLTADQLRGLFAAADRPVTVDGELLRSGALAARLSEE